MSDAIRVYHMRPTEGPAASHEEIVLLAEAVMEGVEEHAELSIRSGIAMRSIARALRSRYFAGVYRAQIKAKALVALDKAVEDAATDLKSGEPKDRQIAREFLRRAAAERETEGGEKEDESWDPSQDEMLWQRAEKLFQGKRLGPGGGTD